MTSKLLDSKKRNHAEKILQRMSKKASASTADKPVESSASRSKGSDTTLSEQYEIIRSDILKLRDDLSKGYDMAKGMIERKGLINQLLKAK